MQTATDESKSGIPRYTAYRISSGIVAVVCSGIAVTIMAFLIPFGILGKCSDLNIMLFMGLLSLSGLLGVTGTVLGGIDFWRKRSRLSIISLLLVIIYVTLILILLELIYL